MFNDVPLVFDRKQTTKKRKEIPRRFKPCQVIGSRPARPSQKGQLDVCIVEKRILCFI